MLLALQEKYFLQALASAIQEATWLCRFNSHDAITTYPPLTLTESLPHRESLFW